MTPLLAYLTLSTTNNMSERYWPQKNIYTDGASMSHISRYLLAKGFIDAGERVVDVACGNGYGSSILGKITKHVYAFDKDNCFLPEYQAKNISFNQMPIENLPPLIKIDTVVSLETIEHLKDPKVLLDWATKVAQRKIIISSPDIPSVGINPHHLSDVEFSKLQKLMENYPEWTLYQVFKQDVYYIAIYVRTNQKLLG